LTPGEPNNTTQHQPGPKLYAASSRSYSESLVNELDGTARRTNFSHDLAAEIMQDLLIPPPDPLESGSHIKVSFPQRMLAVELRM